jgi:adenosylcobinamide-GDP ribazoletransferase
LKLSALIRSFLGAIAFYTAIPLPPSWPLDLGRVARWAPLVGLLLGGCLAVLDAVLQAWGMASLTRSGLTIAFWVLLTGGLHLDGVADTADGLAVTEPQRRLSVMQDSLTGAFGVMAVVLVLLLKVAALSDLPGDRSLALMAAAGWGRWGQVAAIAFYPYLKPTGKGAFHKQVIRLPQDLLWSLPLLLLFPLLLTGGCWRLTLALAVNGVALALLVGFWFYRCFGGQTGDTYGAIVEWTEVLFLVILSF